MVRIAETVLDIIMWALVFLLSISGIAIMYIVLLIIFGILLKAPS